METQTLTELEKDRKYELLTALEYHTLEQLENRRYDMPLRREDLAGRLRWRGLIGKKDDRAMRKAIENLRKQGYLICHRKDSDGCYGGYYIAASKAEYEDFRTREYKSRIISLADTLRGMDKAAEVKFGEEIQLDLFKI